MIELRYFAWVRERIGKSHEVYEGSAANLSELLDELTAKDVGYEAAFSEREILRFAIDQELSGLDARLDNAREVAIFPPMTGG